MISIHYVTTKMLMIYGRSLWEDFSGAIFMPNFGQKGIAIQT
jgi:hypothetical protein